METTSAVVALGEKKVERIFDYHSPVTTPCPCPLSGLFNASRR